MFGRTRGMAQISNHKRERKKIAHTKSKEGTQTNTVSPDSAIHMHCIYTCILAHIQFHFILIKTSIVAQK